MGFFICPAVLQAQNFFFNHEPDSRYRILSTVQQEVFLDRVFSHRAEILNRIAVEVGKVENGKAFHRAVFQTSERLLSDSGGNPSGFLWAREYNSEFERDRRGILTIGKEFYMPVVRNVPVFPDKTLAVGDTWTHEGYEVHDFRANFGIEEPYTIPFTANYQFLGDREYNGNTYKAFSVSYRILLEPPAVHSLVWPRRILGASDQVVYWDADLGQPAAYHEEFRYIFELSNARTVEYRGFAEAHILESSRMDKEHMLLEIEEELNRLNLSDVSVRAVEEGITLSLDAIQFYADSAKMLPGETAKLDKIADILRLYNRRDIMVSGHTARAGTIESQMELSQQRADVVAQYLVEKGVREEDRVVSRGFGAEKPVADNTTEAGRLRNRRVEITILEN